MKNGILLVFFTAMSTLMVAQHEVRFHIVDEESYEPLAGATVYVEALQTGATADLEGWAQLDNIPAGSYEFRFRYLGYRENRVNFSIPLAGGVLTVIALAPFGEELETVQVSSTRRSRSIEGLPTRIEVITAEELDENAVMNSANISMLLRESTGIQVQQTSASSANLSLRIQGLDGRHTQILKDGFPLFGGFAGGLSLMQVPPLDLRQVEVIKGSSSTLYGGGAIAGIVNLLTKVPEEEPEFFLMFNQTQAGSSTINGFYSEQYDRGGLTFYTSGNYQSVYDANEDDFSDLPQIKSVSFNPSFFYTPDEDTRLRIGLNTTFENRLGGDVTRIRGGQPVGEHQFFEENGTERLSSQVSLDKDLRGNLSIGLKNSFNYFHRSLTLPDYRFEGRQLASFWEANFSTEDESSSWIGGLNLWTDRFLEERTSLPRSYRQVTLGGFVQNTWAFSDLFSLESGLRTDHNTDYRWFVLPRLSLLLKLSEAWTFRLGAGLGYQLPTIFTEEAERLNFRNILPLDRSQAVAERSMGGNLDLNFKTILFDRFSFTINTLLFYTRLSDALTLMHAGENNFVFSNASGAAFSRGLETNARLTYGDLTLFLNYAWIDARVKIGSRYVRKAITPEHNLGATLMYEGERWRVGYELYYTGKQYVSGEERVRNFWVMGFMTMRNWEKIALFVNFENFTDTRQSRFGPVYTPPHQNPDFFPIWAPTEGFIGSVGIKLSLSH